MMKCATSPICRYGQRPSPPHTGLFRLIIRRFRRKTPVPYARRRSGRRRSRSLADKVRRGRRLPVHGQLRVLLHIPRDVEDQPRRLQRSSTVEQQLLQPRPVVVVQALLTDARLLARVSRPAAVRCSGCVALRGGLVVGVGIGMRMGMGMAGTLRSSAVAGDGD